MKRVLLVAALIFLACVGYGFGVVFKLFVRPPSENSAPGASGIGSTISQIWTTLGDPRSGFPGQSRVTVLCMGIDDNWTDKDIVYTKGARSDTLFILTLDLDNHKASVLSIPRDTYAHIAGTRMNTKINAAYETGGPERAIATVDDLLGVHCDYYVVLNIDSTKRMVDALGGVDVNVEHEMHYHDSWGHLSIDLMPGLQHLNGDQAVGFARYRHPDAGKKATPEDGDERRTYRQHVLFKAMSQQAKSFQNVLQVNSLMDVAMSTIQTDLRRDQILDLANIFHGVQPGDILSATLPGDDFRGPNGEWFIRIRPEASKAYVQWLVFGDMAGARHLTPVVIRNDTDTSGLAAIAAAVLRSRGYTDVRVEGAAGRARSASSAAAAPPVTTVVDTGVPDASAGNEVTADLGLTSAQVTRAPNEPKNGGWTAPACVTVTLGEDYKAVAPATAPEAPDAMPASTDRLSSRHRRHASTVQDQALPPDDIYTYSAPGDVSQADAPPASDAGQPVQTFPTGSASGQPAPETQASAAGGQTGTVAPPEPNSAR